MSFPPGTEMFQFPGFASTSYVFRCRYLSLGGLPHSDIHGSKPARGSPWLFAACHVLHRLLVPRHPPNALIALEISPIMHRSQPRSKSKRHHSRPSQATQHIRIPARSPTAAWLHPLFRELHRSDNSSARRANPCGSTHAPRDAPEPIHTCKEPRHSHTDLGYIQLRQTHQTFSSVTRQTPTNIPTLGGGDRDRTDDPLLAKQVLSQLSYTPKKIGRSFYWAGHPTRHSALAVLTGNCPLRAGSRLQRQATQPSERSTNLSTHATPDTSAKPTLNRDFQTLQSRSGLEGTVLGGPGRI